MMHMCGCVEKFLPRLIELGLDVYDVVQPTTPEMDIAVLQEAIRRPADVLRLGVRADDAGLGHAGGRRTRSPSPARSVSPRRTVSRPTHAIQVGSPLENILTMYRTAGSLMEQIDSSILDLRDDNMGDKINSSKLF